MASGNFAAARALQKGLAQVGLQGDLAVDHDRRVQLVEIKAFQHGVQLFGRHQQFLQETAALARERLALGAGDLVLDLQVFFLLAAEIGDLVRGVAQLFFHRLVSALRSVETAAAAFSASCFPRAQRLGQRLDRFFDLGRSPGSGSGSRVPG